MFAIYADGNLLYDTTQEDKERILLNMKICLEANTPGKFSFVMPPGHALHGSVENQKTNITVMQDGEIIFYGRVISTNTDRFNQKSVNCECALAYFLDSLQRSYEYDGTPLGLFRFLVERHNEMVEEEQRFTIGLVTAVEDNGTAQVRSEEYTDTMQELKRRMINAYGGYLRVRTVDGVHYIDYLADGDENAQEIEIGVNLLDLQKSITADERFNVLIPKGAMKKGTNGRYTEALTVKEVNNGLDYIVDEEAVAQCGKRIWKTRTWDYINDAEKLLAKGQEYLATGISDETTLTIKAVDMHFIDKAVQRIGILHKVRILSNPHGVDVKKVCQKIEGELKKPEEMQYTFGKPRLTLTDNIVIAKKQSGSGSGSGKTLIERMDGLTTWAYAFADEEDARYQITTGAINKMNGNASGADIDLNGVVPLVKLSAHTQDIDTLTGKINQAEASIVVNANGIKSIVENDGVISLINQTSGKVTIQADKIDLQGYVRADNLETYFLAGYDVVAGQFETESLDVTGNANFQGLLSANSISADELKLSGSDTAVSWKSKSVVTGLANLQTVKIDGTYYRVLPETGFGYTTSTIYYLGR